MKYRCIRGFSPGKYFTAGSIYDIDPILQPAPDNNHDSFYNIKSYDDPEIIKVVSNKWWTRDSSFYLVKMSVSILNKNIEIS